MAESMADYAAELEASFKVYKVGDIITGTVVSVTDTEVLVDLENYSSGIITKENISNDPDFNMKEQISVGDTIEATVVKKDDGEGNIVLSRKEAADKAMWDTFREQMQERTIFPVTINEVVNGGVTVKVKGVRGFIPASRVDAEYVENLEEYKGKTIDVTIIEADEEHDRLVLSGREAARAKAKEETSKKIAKCEVGVIMDGTVESIQSYGAFVRLENGLSGLVHVSQISAKRVSHPGAVVKVGQKVTCKIISTKDGKLSLSMKEVEKNEAPVEEVYEYHESGEATTSLGSLFAGFKFD